MTLILLSLIGISASVLLVAVLSWPTNEDFTNPVYLERLRRLNPSHPLLNPTDGDGWEYHRPAKPSRSDVSPSDQSGLPKTATVAHQPAPPSEPGQDASHHALPMPPTEKIDSAQALEKFLQTETFRNLEPHQQATMKRALRNQQRGQRIKQLFKLKSLDELSSGGHGTVEY